MGKSRVRTASSVFAAALCSSVWYFPTLALAQQASLPTNDQLWNLRMIGADKALERGFTGRGFTIGIVDDIVQADHPEFTGRWLGGFDIGGEPYVIRDTDFHGTHVAGIAAGANVGVARGASLVGINIFSDGTFGSILFGYRFGLLNGVRAFNNSWGFSDDQGETADTRDISREDIELYYSDLLQAYRETTSAGAIQVFATANTPDPQPSWLAGLPYFFPELRSIWLAVMSVGPNATRASYSNACGVAAQWCLAAPGGDFATGQPNSGIWSAWPGSRYNQIQGTSMAAPTATGALAVAAEVFPRASGAELVQLLLQSATDIGATGVDDIYGWGLLNLNNVVTAADPITGSALANASWSRFSTLQHVGSAIPQAQFDGGVPASTQADGLTTASIGLGRDGASLSVQSPGVVGVWTAGLYGRSDLERSATSTGATSSTVGFLIGVDAFSGPTYRIGGAAGLSRNDLDGAGDKANIDGSHLLLYGDWKKRGWFVSGMAQLAFFDQSVIRSNISGAEGTSVTPTGRSSVSGIATQANLRVGHGWMVRNFEIAPYVSATARQQASESFAESGAGIFSLSVGELAQEQYELGSGVRFTSGEWFSRGISVRGSLDLAYANLSGDRTFETTSNLLGTAIQARTADVGQHIFNVGAQAKVTGGVGRVSGVLSYNGRFQRNTTGHSLSAGLQAKF